jgi:hypothetical protein
VQRRPDLQDVIELGDERAEEAGGVGEEDDAVDLPAKGGI